MQRPPPPWQVRRSEPGALVERLRCRTSSDAGTALRSLGEQRCHVIAACYLAGFDGSLSLAEALQINWVIEQCEGLHDRLVVVNREDDSCRGAVSSDDERAVRSGHVIDEGGQSIPNSGQRQRGHSHDCSQRLSPSPRWSGTSPHGTEPPRAGTAVSHARTWRRASSMPAVSHPAPERSSARRRAVEHATAPRHRRAAASGLDAGRAHGARGQRRTRYASLGRVMSTTVTVRSASSMR